MLCETILESQAGRVSYLSICHRARLTGHTLRTKAEKAEGAESKSGEARVPPDMVIAHTGVVPPGGRCTSLQSHGVSVSQ